MMNENLKNLMLKHGLHKHISEDCQSRMEFLAEVLIRECARLATATPCPYENEEIRGIYGHTWDMACVQSGKQIAEHFGVKNDR